MKQFFKRIRRKIILDIKEDSSKNTDKTKRYLKYAFGELTLLVLGILIALQINNWNDKRIENNEEKKILNNLHSEFQENLTNLKIVKDNQTKTIQAMLLVFKLIENQEINYPERQFDSLLSISINSPTWQPSDYVLLDLKSSGRLSKLKNKKLKKLLFEWSIHYSDLTETQTKVEETNNELIEFIKNHGSLKNIDRFSEYFNDNATLLNINNLALLKDYKFENYIDDKLFILKVAHAKYKPTKDIILKILNESKYE